jgi:hypothetical protein
MTDKVRDNIARNRFARLFPVLMKKNTTEKQKHMSELIRMTIDRFPMAGSPLVSQNTWWKLFFGMHEDVVCGDFSKERGKRQNKKPECDMFTNFILQSLPGPG